MSRGPRCVRIRSMGCGVARSGVQAPHEAGHAVSMYSGLSMHWFSLCHVLHSSCMSAHVDGVRSTVAGTWVATLFLSRGVSSGGCGELVTCRHALAPYLGRPCAQYQEHADDDTDGRQCIAGQCTTIGCTIASPCSVERTFDGHAACGEPIHLVTSCTTAIIDNVIKSGVASADLCSEHGADHRVVHRTLRLWPRKHVPKAQRLIPCSTCAVSYGATPTPHTCPCHDGLPVWGHSQVEHAQRVPRQRRELGHRRVLPHHNLILAVPMRRHNLVDVFRPRQVADLAP